MPTLVLLRHGESTWNKENRFTGWTDVDLSATGIDEAHAGGRLLKAEGLRFDVAYTSVLKRAIRTLWIALDEMDLMWLPVATRWRLNERHYGALQGLNKAETAAKFGEEQVRSGGAATTCRRPPLDAGRPALPGPRPALRAACADAELPLTESPQGHRRPLPARLARDDRAGDPLRQAGPHRRPRQQPAGPGEVPRRHLRRGHRRAQHPDRRARSSTSSTTTSGRRPAATWATRTRVAAAMAAVAAQGKAKVGGLTAGGTTRGRGGRACATIRRAHSLEVYPARGSHPGHRPDHRQHRASSSPSCCRRAAPACPPTFGGDSAVYRSRRGIERRLWQFTIVLAVLFVLFSIGELHLRAPTTG